MPPACINVGPFATEGEAKEAALSALICASPAVCSTTRAGEDPWGLLAYRFPAYPMTFRKALHYTTTFWNNVVPNCDRQGSAGITIRKDRRVECPFGYQPDTTWDHCLRSTQADCGPCDTRGNPVNVLSAEKVQTEIDYLSGAPSGISFIRHYRSYGHAARDTGRTSGMLGNYWRTNLDRTVSIGMAGTNTVAHVDRLDGPVKSFVLTNGDWVPHTDKQSRLQTVMNSSGSLAGWFYADGANQWEVFDAAGRLSQLQYASGARQSFVYSDAATPASVAPRPGLLIAASDETSGRTMQFRFDGYGRMTTIVDPAGQETLLDYGGATALTADGQFRTNALTSVTYPDGSTKAYHYNEAAHTTSGSDPFNALTGITDELGARYATFGYYGTQAVRTEHYGGVDKYAFSYSGSYTYVTDPLETQSLVYNTSVLGIQHNAGSSQPAGSGSAAAYANVAYDAAGNVASRDDFNGKRTCYASDLSRNPETARIEGLAGGTNCSTVTGTGASLPAGARKVSTAWHPDWRLVARVAEPSRITTSVYNGQPDPFAGGAQASCAPASALLPDGKPIAVLCRQVEQATTDANGSLGFSATLDSTVANREQKWTYNQWGQVLSHDGPRTDVADITTYSYYSDTSFTGVGAAAVGHTIGDLQSVTNAAGKVTQYTKYDKHGQLLESVDPNGVVSTNSYDLRQRLLSTSVGGQTTSYTYDLAGQLKRVTRPDASWIGFDYDPAHRQTAVYDNLGNRIEYTLDNAGNRTAESVKDTSGALRRQLARSIDALGRVQQVTGAQ